MKRVKIVLTDFNVATVLVAAMMTLLSNADLQAQTGNLRSFFKQHCVRCHGPDLEQGGLRVDQLKYSLSDHTSIEHLQNILDELTTESMPPRDEPQPDADDLAKVCEILTKHLSKAQEENNSGGGKPVRRLTRTEYINTVRDLMGIEVNPKTLPADTSVGSFDTDATLLYLTDLHFENYLQASRTAVRHFIASRDNESGERVAPTPDKPRRKKKGGKRKKAAVIPIVGNQAFAFFQKPLPGRRMPLINGSAKDIIREFAELISRGKDTDREFLGRLNKIFNEGRQQGESFWEALVEPMAVSMCSIEFLMHFEDKSSVKETGMVSGVELANRLSYFLWRSAPDEELLALGQSGELLQTKIKTKQIDRMMDSEKFERFLRDFSDQWLELERQEQIAVDKRLFPKFEEQLKKSMREETVQFVSHVIREDLPLKNLIDSDFMVLNEAIAKHYGVAGVSGNQFRSVERGPDDQYRGGILTHAGILMQTTTGERTSVVERGAFVARKLLNDPPPPPPPNVAELPTEGQNFARMTAAEMVRAHASSRQCASCHNGIDPLGLGLEEFDVIGRHRTVEKRLDPRYFKLPKRAQRKRSPFFQVPLETKGKVLNRKSFKGINGLKKALLTHQDRLSEAYVEALLTFANGRKAGAIDKSIVDDITERASELEYPARSILKAVVYSKAFTGNAPSRTESR